MTAAKRSPADPAPRRFWRTATVLPTVATTVLGVAAAVAVTGAAPALRLASFADGSPIGALTHSTTVPGGLLVRGWDFDYNAPRTPLWTFAKVDGTRVGRTRADQTRAFLATQHPKAGTAHGFKWVVPVPEGKHTVCVAAASIGKGSAARLGCVTHNFNYGPFGHLDVVDTVPGAIHVKGWTIDSDNPTQALTTTVTIDGTAHTLLANLNRPDIVAKHPLAGPDHGFEATYQVSQGKHTVCVTVTNIGFGSDNSLGCATVTLNDSPIGAVTKLGQRGSRIVVRGWAFDPDRPTDPLKVRVRVDNGTPTTLVANQPNQAVADAHPEAGPDHGFTTRLHLAEGSHNVCVTAQNLGYGHRSTLTCQKVALDFTPSAGLLRAFATHTGAWLKGWAFDPDTTDPIKVQITVDGAVVETVPANQDVPGHRGHGFAVPVPVTSGQHTICAIGLNVLYGTHNSTPACRKLTFAFSPLGSYTTLARASDGSNDLLVRGYAFDPDTTGPISVAVTLDGQPAGTVSADHWRQDVGKRYPRFGHKHGFADRLSANSGEHTVCVVAKNVGGGSDTNLGCKIVNAVNPQPPSAPQTVIATPGYGAASVAWQPPASDGGAPWTSYVVTANPGGTSVTVPGTSTAATVSGLASNASYSFSVVAVNVAGKSPAGVSNTITTQTGPPPQRTPAPVSTSRYIRNISGSSATDLATMRREGYADAQANPSGHRYLILLDIGGQDQYDGGVVLSATTRFVSYADLERDLRAYVDGYRSGQRSGAPVVIAAGTNNDMDVSATSGQTWASTIVGPLRRYASKYPNMTIAGANDMEPGFRATYRQTSAWLGGYLSATKAPFVFNGSADGCSWTQPNSGCNNGWRMGGLYHLAAGAAPTRIINLPQVYNTAMAGQWKYISITGILHGLPRINFGGPLTEWTACEQDRSCGSLTGHSAWTALWDNLQSDTRLKINSLPYSTDLRIDS
jgi:hypothetical protein